MNGYGKIKTLVGEYVCSPTFQGTREQIVLQVKAWFFDRSFDNCTPHAIFIKPTEGGTYELLYDVDGAAQDLHEECFSWHDDSTTNEPTAETSETD